MAVRDSSQDTIPELLQTSRPLPSAVRTMGETCRSRVPPGANTSPALQSAFELALRLGDSTASLAALAQWLATPQTLADRGESAFDTRVKRFYTAITQLLDDNITGPLQGWGVAQAKKMVPRLDSMKAYSLSLATQQNILEAETEWRNQMAGKFAAPERVLHDYLALIPAFDSASDSVSLNVGKYLGGVGFLIIRIEQAQDLIDKNHTMSLLDSLATHSTRAGPAAAAWMNTRKQDFAMVGQPVPSLHAQFWYNTHGDSVWPVPGHVSLIVMGEQSALNAPLLRLLAQRYGPRGLRICVVSKTKGYWNRNGTETGPRTAAQEAAQDSAYYLQYLKLPVTVAIAEAQFTRFPDGHYAQAAPVQYERDLVPLAPYGNFVLTDASGRLLDTWGSGSGSRYMIARLDRLLGVNAP
jgi:hypothetical protein